LTRYSSGSKNGKGHFIWSDGSAYEGEFKDNNINGKGTYSWNDGRTYTGRIVSLIDQGAWLNNKMNGEGSFRWPGIDCRSA